MLLTSPYTAQDSFQGSMLTGTMISSQPTVIGQDNASFQYLKDIGMSQVGSFEQYGIQPTLSNVRAEVCFVLSSLDTALLSPLHPWPHVPRQFVFTSAIRPLRAQFYGFSPLNLRADGGFSFSPSVTIPFRCNRPSKRHNFQGWQRILASTRLRVPRISSKLCFLRLVSSPLVCHSYPSIFVITFDFYLHCARSSACLWICCCDNGTDKRVASASFDGTSFDKHLHALTLPVLSTFHASFTMLLFITRAQKTCVSLLRLDISDQWIPSCSEQMPMHGRVARDSPRSNSPSLTILWAWLRAHISARTS